MYKKIKEEIKDIIQIVNECPDSLKEKCFEILLSNLLSEVNPKENKANQQKQKETEPIEKLKSDVKETLLNETDGKVEIEEEISKSDLHMKTRRFIEGETISYEIVNKIYYKDNGKILPLYDDLGTTKMAESQIRQTLLMAFENSFESGEFEINGEVVKKKCQDLKCFDSPNFAKNFKTSKDFFDGFESYDKSVPIRLSTDGKKELAKVLKLIAK